MIVGSFVRDRMDMSVSDWLYGEWDEGKYKTFTALYSIPGVREYFDYLLDQRADAEYLNRYGMDYSDIHDPRKLRQTAATSRLVGSSLNFVSRNLSKLYRD